MTRSSQPIFLSDLFDANDKAALERQVAEAVVSDGALKGLVAGNAALSGAIVKAVTGAMHFEPLAVLAEGWRTARAIHAYRDPAKYPPDTTAILKLGKHSIERDIKPEITIKLGADQHFPLDLAMTLSGVFEGIELFIRNGKILAVGSGTCHLALSFKVAGHGVTERKTLATLKLPGAYEFVQPLAIP